MEKVQITREGHQKLLNKLHDMKGRGRTEVADELEEARSHGDLRENADYDAAKEKQGMLEANIRMLEDQVARAEIIDLTNLPTHQVAFGLVVTFENLETERVREYQIVGESEADLSQKKISVTAPIIKPMIGKEVGDIVEVELNGEVQELEILEIKRAL